MTYLYPYRRGTGWRSQGFRTNRNLGSNGPGGHTGFDQAMAAGQPLYAPGDGIIRNSGWLSDNYRDNGWWLTRMGGDTLVIDMVDNFRRSSSLPTFILAHCSDTMAEVGQFVRKGQLVALSGNTGTATTGPHVHIEALPPNWDFGNGVYGRVDPEIYFDEWVDDYTSGLAAMGGTITPVSEQGFLMALTDQQQADLFNDVQNIKGYLYAGGPSVEGEEGNPDSLFGRVIGVREDTQDIRLALTSFIPAMLSKKDGAVDIPELAKALAGQLADADVRALADQLQITVKGN